MPPVAELITTAHVQLLPVADHSEVYDERRARFAAPSVTTWVPGQLTLTRRQLSCVVTRPGPGGSSFVLDLADVTAVEIEAGWMPRLVTIRTADRIVHVRTAGAAAYAKRIAIAREAAQRATSVRH